MQSLIALDNGQRQEIKNFVFGRNCSNQKSHVLVGNNLNLQSFILPSKCAIWMPCIVKKQ